MNFLSQGLMSLQAGGAKPGGQAGKTSKASGGAFSKALSGGSQSFEQALAARAESFSAADNSPGRKGSSGKSSSNLPAGLAGFLKILQEAAGGKGSLPDGADRDPALLLSMILASGEGMSLLDKCACRDDGASDPSACRPGEKEEKSGPALVLSDLLENLAAVLEASGAGGKEAGQDAVKNLTSGESKYDFRALAALILKGLADESGRPGQVTGRNSVQDEPPAGPEAAGQSPGSGRGVAGLDTEALLGRINRILEGGVPGSGQASGESAGTGREAAWGPDMFPDKGGERIRPGDFRPADLLEQAKAGQGDGNVRAEAGSRFFEKTGRAPTMESRDSELRNMLNELAGRIKDSSGQSPGQGLENQLKNSSEQGPERVMELLADINSSAAKSDKGSGSAENTGSRTEAVFNMQADPVQGAKTADSGPSFKAAARSFDQNLQAAEARVVSQVFVRLFNGARQGSGEMIINMHPPELGHVKVRIVSEQGHLNINLHPQNHQVAGILEKNLPALQQSLTDQGIEFSDLHVSVDSGNEQEQQQQFDDHWLRQSAEGEGISAENAPDEGEDEFVNPGSRAGRESLHEGLSLRI